MTTEAPTRSAPVLEYDRPRPTSKAMLWTGRVISAIPVLMMGVGGLIVFLFFPDQMKEMTKYGYPDNVLRPIFILELIFVLLYVIPQTAVLGAILLTGYLGGAVATHVRASELSQAPVPIVVAALVWLGLLLRDARLRTLLPFRRTT